MKITATVCVSKGKVRTNNEDNYFLNGSYLEKGAMDVDSSLTAEADTDCQLYAVCDGMGGEADGEEASYIAASSLSQFAEKLSATEDAALIDLLDAYTETVNTQILAYGKRGRMGTTLAMLLMRDDYAYAAHMGDSRIYQIRERQIIAYTADHTEANRLLSLGMITEEQHKNHPMRNALIRYLGMYYPSMQITAELKDLGRLLPGDRFLLCSDGLTDLVSEQGILQAIQGLSARDAAAKLVQCALEAGGTDNVTVMIVDVAAMPWRHRFLDAIASRRSERKDKTITG